MGQKAHPRGLRLGIIETWDSKWYSEKEYANWLHEDLEIQNYIKEQLFRAAISKIEIERWVDKCTIHIHTARPGIVIGRRGAEVEKLTTDLERLVGRDIRIMIEEIRRPELDAQLVAEGIALQLERRSAYKVAMKKAVAAAMRAGAEGIKILCSGRLSGIEMARKEKEQEGRVPLHTLRANINYGFVEAKTMYGKIGVKVWIFKGEIIGKPEEEEGKPAGEFPGERRRIDIGRMQEIGDRGQRRPRGGSDADEDRGRRQRSNRRQRTERLEQPGEGDRPSDRRRRPSGGSRPGGGNRPSDRRGRPGGGNRPSGGRGRPGGGNRPSGGRGRPGGGNRPSDGRGRPGGGNRPSGGRERPGGGNRPSGGRERPGGGNRPSGGRERPSGGNRPSGGGERSNK